ncbi:SUKH-4 family immunity protein [Streptomyces sp. MN13]
MIFDLDHESLTDVVGEENVHLLPQSTAEQYGFTGETLGFLTEVGIPSSEEWELPFGLPADFDPELLWDRASREQRGWTFPAGVKAVVPIGNFPVNAVVIDPGTGVVYQYTDALQEIVPIHRDLSSLARTLTAFVGYIESYEQADGESPEGEDARRQREVETLLADIKQADPLPFAHELSEWNELFENLSTGVYT